MPSQLWALYLLLCSSFSPNWFLLEYSCFTMPSWLLLYSEVNQPCWRRKWQPIPVFLPGEFMDRGAWQVVVHTIHVAAICICTSSLFLICIHIIPLFCISFPFRSPQNFQKSSPRYTVGSHQLPVLYIVSTMYICQYQSPKSSHPYFLTLVTAHLLSVSVSLYPLCKGYHLYHFYRFHKYVLIYDICFSLSFSNFFNLLILIGG